MVQERRVPPQTSREKPEGFRELSIRGRAAPNHGTVPQGCETVREADELGIAGRHLKRDAQGESWVIPASEGIARPGRLRGGTRAPGKAVNGGGHEEGGPRWGSHVRTTTTTHNTKGKVGLSTVQRARGREAHRGERGRGPSREYMIDE